MGTGEEPPARRQNGRRRRRWDDDGDDDDEEYVADEEEEEEDFAEELHASSAGEEGDDSDAEYQVDGDEEEEEEETPRPVKGAARSRKGKMDPATARARKRRYEEDDDYEEEPDEDEEYHEEIEEEEDEEEEEARPRPKSMAKCAKRGRSAKLARSNHQKFDEDMDFEPELDDDEEEVDDDIDFDPAQSNRRKYEEIDDEEDEEEASPRRKSVAKRARRGRNTELAWPNCQKFEDDVDFEPEQHDDDEADKDIDFNPVQSNQRKFEEIVEEEEEPEEAPSQPKSVAKCARRGHDTEVARANRRKSEEDMDFEPELDDDEEEADEDIDFDPELDEEEEYEFEDEDEDEFAVRSRKVTVKNSVKRKSISKRRSLKRKKVSKGSKVSKRKAGSSKAKKSAYVRRQKKRFDDYEEESEDDDDFIVEDQVEVNRPPRKKARTGTNKRTELDRPSVVEEETWPNLDSDTSDFEFVTSDEDRDDAETTAVGASTVRKGRKKRKSGSSESSSDSEFVVSDKELENLKETEPLKFPPVLSTPIRKISISTRHGEDKGKEKEEAGVPICGICLSEEQRATVQGVLNCCSHYFCFACIMEWSRVESRCPLCKQRFTTITKSSKADLGLGLRKAIIKVEERDQVYQPTEEEIRRWLDPYENVVCIECNQGGDDSLMLLCDICDSSAHTYCVGLGREVPDGNWYCGGCRLGDEGPSHARIPHTVGYERQSYRNHVDFNSVGFGIAAQNGTYDRSSSINRHRSLQGIDLNLSPREAPGEIHPAESQASTDSVSTPSGTRATVSGRRQIHRYIRILLSRPRQHATRVDDMLPNLGQRNGAVPRTEPIHRNFRSSSEANTSQILPDGFQNQYNGLPFAPVPLDGDDFQHIEGVRSNLKNTQ